MNHEQRPECRDWLVRLSESITSLDALVNNHYGEFRQLQGETKGTVDSIKGIVEVIQTQLTSQPHNGVLRHPLVVALISLCFGLFIAVVTITIMVVIG